MKANWVSSLRWNRCRWKGDDSSLSIELWEDKPIRKSGLFYPVQVPASSPYYMSQHTIHSKTFSANSHAKGCADLLQIGRRD